MHPNTDSFRPNTPIIYPNISISCLNTAHIHPNISPNKDVTNVFRADVSRIMLPGFRWMLIILRRMLTVLGGILTLRIIYLMLAYYCT